MVISRVVLNTIDVTEKCVENLKHLKEANIKTECSVAPLITHTQKKLVSHRDSRIKRYQFCSMRHFGKAVINFHLAKNYNKKAAFSKQDSKSNAPLHVKSQLNAKLCENKSKQGGGNDKTDLKPNSIMKSSKLNLAPRSRKKHKCDICAREFGNRSHLKIHIRAHSGEKPYTCDICQKAFSQKNNLKTHLKAHTKERNFKCNICSKAYREKYGLKIHLLSHGGQKPFRCGICAKEFNRPCDLKKHNFKNHSA